MYISRGLSLRGAEFEMVEVKLCRSDIEAYDAAAAWWRELFSAVLESQSRGSLDLKSPRSYYWAAHQVPIPCIARRPPSPVGFIRPHCHHFVVCVFFCVCVFFVGGGAVGSL